MQRLKMHTPDITDKNIEKIAALFPNCITEMRQKKGAVMRAIDFDQLRQELSKFPIVDGPQERYQLNWPGKHDALAFANTSTSKTLRPCRKESIDFDKTKNLFIEGDNLDALKLLQETYLNSIKMIYIDPPYNTGHDFIYSDNFRESNGVYAHNSSQVDEDGNRMVLNPESHGRFHSDWLSMMYSRLKLARNLLSEDGVIFVSIDDKEMHNLRKICDEVFSETNCFGVLVWQHSIQPKGYLGKFSVHHNFILCYCKGDRFELSPLERTEEHNKSYSNSDNDPNGDWRAGDVRNALYRPNLKYKINTPSGKTILPPENGWRWSKETLDEKIRTGEIIFSADETKIIRKIYLNRLQGRTPETILFGKDVGTTRLAAKEIQSLFDNKQMFDTPKPTALIRYLMGLAGLEADDIVMDFFSGSSTTAHAVMQVNAQNNSNYRFIMVQIPQVVNENSEAYKFGFKNIAEISKERIRRAGNQIKENNASKEGIKKLDVGFRVLKIDESNMTDVYYTPDELTQSNLISQIDHIREDRTPDDLLFQILLDLGVELTLPIIQKKISGKTIFFVDPECSNALMACFDKNISEDLVKDLATYKPQRMIFRDASFESDSLKINVEQIFKHLSPDTEIKTL